jgi:SsrA-binding protein
MKRSGKAAKTDPNNRILASNRRARHDYEILGVIECGLVLRGSEVKSLREAKVHISDAFGKISGNEMWLQGLHIGPYSHAGGFDSHHTERERKLLAHRDEIDRWRDRVNQEHLSLVPLSLYLKDGRAKIELALGRGRKRYDRRQVIAKRDAEMETRKTAARTIKYGAAGGRG